MITNTSDRNFILRCQIGIFYVAEMFVAGIVPSAPFLYPLKTRNLFWCFRGVEKGCIGNEWVNWFYITALHWSITNVSATVHLSYVKGIIGKIDKCLFLNTNTYLLPKSHLFRIITFWDKTWIKTRHKISSIHDPYKTEISSSPRNTQKN